MRIATIVATTAVLVTSAYAQRDPYAKLGNWWAYGNSAMTVKGRLGLGVNCETGDASVMLILQDDDKQRFTSGEMLRISFRADRLPEIQTIGKARNERAMEVMTPPDMIRQIQNGKKVTFRVTGEKTAAFTRDYDVTGAAVVVPEVLKGCPLD